MTIHRTNSGRVRAAKLAKLLANIPREKLALADCEIKLAERTPDDPPPLISGNRHERRIMQAKERLASSRRRQAIAGETKIGD